MSRILLAWELGGGLGHLGRLATLACGLRERGHEVTLAVKDLSRVASVTGLIAFPVLQAPVWLGASKDLPEPPLNFAEILARFGYLDSGGLCTMVKAWRGLFALLNPDLIVAEYAPTALLAARGLEIPRVTYGSGFFSPPRTYPLPNMRPWLDVPAAKLAASDDKVLSSVNQVLSVLRVPPLATLADLLNADADFLLTFRELDHYRNRGPARYYGVVSGEGTGLGPPWPDGAGKRVFVYLHGEYRDAEKILSLINALACRAVVFAPGIAPAIEEKFRSSRIRFSAQAVAISQVARQCDLAICHGGMATSTAFLLAGCPLLLLPMHLEQYLLSVNVQDLGAGLLINSEEPNPDRAGIFRRLLKESSFKARAMDFAEQYSDHNPARVMQEIITRCEEIIASPRSGER